MLNDYKIYEESLLNRLKEFENCIIKLKENPIYYINFEFKDTKILNNLNEKIMISNWINPNSKIKFNLLYQISRDGDKISTFYNKVKNKYPTLILIKSKSGYKFGGYTNQTWEQSNDYKKDELAFLFSLNKQKKYNIKNDQIQYTIYGCSYFFNLVIVVI